MNGSALRSSSRGNGEESIVDMRREIMESLHRSPTKLYHHRDTNGQAGSRTASSNSQRRQQDGRTSAQSVDVSMDYSSRSDPASDAKVIGNYNDDIFDAEGQAPNGNQASYKNTQHDNNPNDNSNGEDDEDGDKLNISFHDNNSIGNSISSHVLSERDSRKKQLPAARVPPTKRVLSRSASPEKQHPASRLPSRQVPNPRKKTRNSPPASNLQTLPAIRPERSKPAQSATLNGRRHPVRPAGSTVPTNNTSQHNENNRKEQPHLLDMNTPRPAAKAPSNTDRRVPSGNNPQEKGAEVEEADGQQDVSHKEVSLIDSTTFFNSAAKVDPSDISKLRAAYSTEVACLKAQLAGKDVELKELKLSMQASEQKAFESEQTLADSLEHVAKELHTQYSKKHEAKVQALKRQHQENMEQRLRGLHHRINELEHSLAHERREKDELVKTCDMYLEMEEQRAQEESHQAARRTVSHSNS